MRYPLAGLIRGESRAGNSHIMAFRRLVSSQLNGQIGYYQPDASPAQTGVQRE
jgi:hypothetical protein